MFEKHLYGRILVPMVTPFADDQTVDYEAAAAIAQKLVRDNNADSIILSGTTGEFHTLTYAERVKLFGVVRDAVGEDIPLIAGTGCASTRETVALTQKAHAMGYKLVMVVAPYYAKPNQTELLAHFRAAAAAADVSVMLYNIPIFTGVNLEPDTVAALAEVPNIVGIKEEAELNPKQITAYLNATPEDFVVYCGDDTMVLEAFAQGGRDRIGGIVSGASHLIGCQLREMIERFLAGDVDAAAALQRRYYRLFRIMGQNQRTNPVALIKEAMKMLGYPAGVPRLPLSPGSDPEKCRVREMLSELGLVDSDGKK